MPAAAALQRLRQREAMAPPPPPPCMQLVSLLLEAYIRLLQLLAARLI